MATTFKPIDDLIEHLKSDKPYDKTGTLKLWEALKSISNQLGTVSGNTIDPNNFRFNGRRNPGAGGLGSSSGPVSQLVINPSCPGNTYDPGYYGCLAVREYMTIFDQVNCSQMLGLFVDKVGTLSGLAANQDRIRIVSTRYGTSPALLPISIEIGDQAARPAFYIHDTGRSAGFNTRSIDNDTVIQIDQLTTSRGAAFKLKAVDNDVDVGVYMFSTRGADRLWGLVVGHGTHGPIFRIVDETAGGAIGSLLPVAPLEGVDRLIIDLSGRVGIGTSTPTGKLQVKGGSTANTAVIKMIGGASSTEPVWLEHCDQIFCTGNLHFNTDSATHIFMLAGGGNMKIGNAAAVPSARVDIHGGTTANTAIIKIIGGASASEPMWLRHADQILCTSAFHINTDSSSNIYLVNGGGNVGIGNMGPNDKLDVSGSIRSRENFKFLSGTSFVGTFDHAITADRTWIFQNVNGTIYQTDGQDVAIADGGTNSSAALNNGRVMISFGGAIVERNALTAAALIVGDATLGITPLALGTANRIVGMNNAANANEYKDVLGTADQITITHGANSITFSLPQNIAPTSNVQFNNIEIDGDLNHDGTNVGFYGVAPVARPSAYTQTYSTANRTHAARTADSITDNTGGTPSTTVADTPAAYDETYFANSLASIIKELNDLRDDQLNTAQVVNQILDDIQSQGLLQ